MLKKRINANREGKQHGGRKVQKIKGAATGPKQKASHFSFEAAATK